MISEAHREALLYMARTVREKAYAPYSDFKVGAAVYASNGEIYAGVNVENASYGLTVCAERNAVGKMVAGGGRQILGVAVATENGVTPCGACRQVLMEFAEDETVPVWIFDEATGDQRMITMGELLPEYFHKGQLKSHTTSGK